MRVQARIALWALACILLPASLVFASEMAGVYALVEKVILEPNAQAPDTIQIWGVIAISEDLAKPKRGYLYYRLPSGFLKDVNDAARKEWADLKSVAGTGQAVAFGQRFFNFSQQSQAKAYIEGLGRIRPASEKPSSPEPYPVNIGMVKLTNSSVVDSLRKVK
jgi:hypothetical protein